MRILLSPIRRIVRKKIPLGRIEILEMRISIIESMLSGVEERLQLIEKENHNRNKY
jgi:hypothetical protein